LFDRRWWVILFVEQTGGLADGGALMRYIIYGAGAIGGAIGGRLFEAGHDVVLICRGAQLDAIRQYGLLLRTPEGDLRLPVPAVGHPRNVAFTPDDAVILTMKTQDTERALHDLETSGGARLPVVCAQNGVENERLAARRFARVYAMLVALPATFLEPGEVIAGSVPHTGVLHAGRYPHGLDATIEQICTDLSRSRFRSDPDPAVMRLKYTKLLTNVGNAIQVITGGEWSDGGLRTMQREAAQEAIACYQAAGIDFASDEEYAARVNRYYRSGVEDSRRRVVSSTLQSVLKGHTTIEVDFLSGEVVLLGALHGVPTPCNSVLRRIAVQMAAAGERPGRHSVSELAAMVASERAAVTV
jgi:2-dehydropantoate 2-reductase